MERLFLQYRNVLYGAISLLSGITYYFIDNKIPTSTIIIGFTLLDLKYNNFIIQNKDYLVHHLLSLSCYASLLYYKFYDYDDIIINPVLSFQISSIFLSIDTYFKNNTFYDRYKFLNFICFFSLFNYYRLYRYYYDTLTNPTFFILLNKYNNLLIIIPYSFYSLNIFWTCIIIKKLVKPLKQVNNYIITEQICKYTLLINIPISLYKYIIKQHTFLLLDTLGHIMLSITSYYYHNQSLLKELYNTSIQKKYIIYDLLTIRCRIILTLITYYYYNNNYNNNYLQYIYFSIGNNILCSCITVYSIINSTTDTYEKNKKNMIKLVNFNVFIDSLMLSYFYNTFTTMYTILFFIGTINYFNILYNFTHILFHIFIIIQTIHICNY
jgi:hypothetical protein